MDSRRSSADHLVLSWLLLKARKDRSKYEEAFRSLRRLRHSEIQAARDLFLIHHLLKRQGEIESRHNRFVDLWTVPRNRRALVASLITMFFQQFCGVNILAYVGLPVLYHAFLNSHVFSGIPESWLTPAYQRNSTPARCSKRLASK